MNRHYLKATFYGIENDFITIISLSDFTWGFQGASESSIWVRGVNDDGVRIGGTCDRPLAILNGFDYGPFDSQLPDCASSAAEETFYSQLENYLANYGNAQDVLVDFRSKAQLQLPFQDLIPYDESQGIAVPQNETFTEGELARIEVNRYYRDRRAREMCIAHYSEGGGIRCHYCGFDFGERYGKDFKGLIQIHHLKPLSDGKRETEPVEDLRPVCGNCHLVIHQGGETLGEAEMKALLGKV